MGSVPESVRSARKPRLHWRKVGRQGEDQEEEKREESVVERVRLAVVQARASMAREKVNE